MNTLIPFICVAMMGCMVQGQVQETGVKCIKTKYGQFYLSLKPGSYDESLNMEYGFYERPTTSSECSDNEKWDIVPIMGDNVEIRHVLCSTSDIKCLLVYQGTRLEIYHQNINEETSLQEGTQWFLKIHPSGSMSILTSYNSDWFMLSIYPWSAGVFQSNQRRQSPGDAPLIT